MMHKKMIFLAVVFCGLSCTQIRSYERIIGPLTKEQTIEKNKKDEKERQERIAQRLAHLTESYIFNFMVGTIPIAGSIWLAFSAALLQEPSFGSMTQLEAIGFFLSTFAGWSVSAHIMLSLLERMKRLWSLSNP